MFLSSPATAKAVAIIADVEHNLRLQQINMKKMQFWNSAVETK